MPLTRGDHPWPLVELRARTKISPDEMADKVGKIITEDDYNVVATGPVKMLKPNGEPLFIYIPNAIPEALADQAYEVLHTIRGVTDNRGLASGGRRIKKFNTGKDKQTRAPNVMSSVIGNFDPMSKRFPYCRTTAWTGSNADEFSTLFDTFRFTAELFKTYVPDRYAVQMRYCEQTQDDWRIADTPYSTMTVNNTYPTGVHKDAGDLEEGFSQIFCLRRGDYGGGVLSFPEYRVAVDLQDRDFIMMDAHEWHGNTAIDARSEDAERISVVLYYRTAMTTCGTMEEEIAKARAAVEKGLGLDDMVPEVRDTVTTKMALDE
jgi:hypothetical protein